MPCRSARPIWRRKGAPGSAARRCTGVPPGTVCIIGGGIVGTNAAKIAVGIGAKVTLVDLNLDRLRELDDIFTGVCLLWPRTL